MVMEAEAIGITLPDPDLRYNEETGHWDFGLIPWDEFWSVVKGVGR
jgi:ring-1,2-phenylacetyl-CoA epoxidase subunit PaaA